MCTFEKLQKFMLTLFQNLISLPLPLLSFLLCLENLCNMTVHFSCAFLFLTFFSSRKDRRWHFWLGLQWHQLECTWTECVVNDLTKYGKYFIFMSAFLILQKSAKYTSQSIWTIKSFSAYSCLLAVSNHYEKSLVTINFPPTTKCPDTTWY